MITPPTSNPLSSLGDAEPLDALRAKEIQDRQRHARNPRSIAEIVARGICNEHGHFVGVVASVREIFNLSLHDVRRMVAHAELLNETISPTGARIEPELPVVAEALAEGAIAPQHVEVISKAMATLPVTASAEDRAVAEKILSEAAVSSEPHIVKRLGEEIERRLDPDGDEPKEKTLRSPRRWLDFRERKDGSVVGTFDLDAEAGTLLANLLSPSPHPPPDPTAETRDPPINAGVKRSPKSSRPPRTAPTAPPRPGSRSPSWSSIPLDDLKTGIGRVLVDGYQNLSAARIRRMACDAKCGHPDRARHRQRAPSTSDGPPDSSPAASDEHSSTEIKDASSPTAPNVLNGCTRIISALLRGRRPPPRWGVLPCHVASTTA